MGEVQRFQTNPLMKTLLSILFLCPTNLAFAQQASKWPIKTYKVDTLFYSKDSSNFFVSEIWDSINAVKTYYCSIDSVDRTFRCGFLGYKVGVSRTYFYKNIREIQHYPQPSKYNIRDADGFPVFILRLK